MRFHIAALAACAALACGSNTPATPPPPPPPPPAAPSGLTVVTTDTTATLQWTASAGAVDYLVSRAPGGTTSFAPVGTVTVTSAADSGLTPNTSYVYAVHARNASGSSPDSTVNATTAPVAPTAPGASASNHHVRLQWTAAPGAGTAGYRVLRSTSASGPFTPVGTATGTSFTDTSLTNNTTYSYVIHTIGGTGESGDSNVASATPFIEICVADGASDVVSVFDGTASGNVSPKRAFGWTTGIAQGTGIGTDGTNIFIASKYTRTVNVYPRASVSGDAAPSRTLALPAQPTALTVDAANSNLYVAMGSNINVYKTTDSGANVTPQWTLNSSGTIRGIQVFSGTSGVTTVNQTFVVSDNHILVYNNGDSGTTAPQRTISPAVPDAATVLVGPAYDSTDDAIFVAWVDRFTLNENVASYGRTTGTAIRAPLISPLDQPGGVVVDGTSIWVVVGNSTPANNALLKYPRTSTGATSPTGGVNGTKVPIYSPGSLLLDPTSNELWFLNGKNGALSYLKTASGNVAPTHSLVGSATGIYDPIAIAADRGAGEIVVLNQSPGHTISVYPRASANPATPARQIAGAVNAKLDTRAPSFLSVDETNSEYWIDDRSSNGFAAFAASSTGDVAPLRQIARDVSTGSVQEMLYDQTAGQVIGISTPAANTFTLAAWNRTDSGNVPADRSATLSRAAAGSPAFDYTHNLLFLFTDSNVLSALPRAFAGGAVTPAASYDSTAVAANLGAVDGEGNELYFWTQDHIAVAPAPSGSALTLSRTIAGSATGLYGVVGLTICN